MCIQLIRTKLRRFHTQAASGSRANFPSSITNFAQNLARMCQGLFYATVPLHCIVYMA